VQNRSVAARRRRSPLTAASGRAQIAYQGKSHAVDASSASVVQPAAMRQFAPRAARHNASASTARNAATKRWRHQLGVPLRPRRRAVSAGTLWTATSCCCSPTALRKPSACAPKPITATAASTARLPTALAPTRRLSRARAGASSRKGSASPAVTLTPTPATSVPAAARKRGLAPAVSASAAASASMIRVSLCAPPTASSSSTGFRPTNAAAKRQP
jgi:hypothetical protein